MQSYFFSAFYLVVVVLLLWQALRVMFKGFAAVSSNSFKEDRLNGDRTGRLTIHPELLNKEGRITDEDLLTVRFSNDPESPPTSERMTE